MDIGLVLRHYKREDIQKAMVEHAQDREIAIKFAKGFGKRPDILKYPRDVLELAKQGATSFHASEELWDNPLRLDLKLKKNELEELRKGWDLVLDVDFEVWEATKIITHALVTALKDHGISSISVKFSGNKGFHIGVPFESFPKQVIVGGDMRETRKLFPESVQRIAMYLINYIDNKENGFATSSRIINCKEFKGYLEKNNKEIDDFTTTICVKCSSQIKLTTRKNKIEFVCPRCEKRIVDETNNEYLKCDKCGIFMERFSNVKNKGCDKCGGNEFTKRFNLKIDTLLISSRHLFRSVYSLHEKSGLVSIPIDPENVMSFDKNTAIADKLVMPGFVFLDRKEASVDEGKKLITEAFDFNPETEESVDKKEVDYEEVKQAIPESFFPPCIHKILKGLQDGKKRSLFILVNFLVSVGWSYDEIEKRLIEWNKSNEEPLRETVIKGHLRYHKQQKNKILPPNCENQMYYKDLRLCLPDNLCQKIKNPINYAVIKTRHIDKKKKDKQ